jgi:hypothetical protein
VTNLIELYLLYIALHGKYFQVDAIYTDFSKAFDKVSHIWLLIKLGREKFVKASGSQSRRLSVRSGIPEGPCHYFHNEVFSCFK